MILVSIWLCGIAANVLAWINRWRRIRQALLRATPLNLGVPIQAMSCPELLEPGVFGIFRPRLILPEGITERLTPTQLQAILTHEFCHVRRRDNLASTIHMIVEAVFWFHPLVWWIETRLLEEQENACDEEVLRLGNDPQTYAEGILKVCEFYLQSPLPCVSGVTGADLKKRLAAIMSGTSAHNLRLGKILLLVAAGIAAVAGPIVGGLLQAPPIQAQARVAVAPKWEVASIKPCAGPPPLARSAPPPTSPGRLTLNCMPVRDLIQKAYVLYANGEDLPTGILRFETEARLRQRPIEGGPAWIDSARYQITAKAEGTPTQAMMNGPMLQALLEDRFNLKVHHGTREVPVYALTVAKGGPKLKAAAEGSCIVFDPEHPPTGEQASMPGCGFWRREAPGIHTISNLGTFCLNLAATPRMDRDIIDKTGINGLFDIHLELSLADQRPFTDEIRDPVADPPAVSVFTAMQQLGLKLEPTKGPVQFLVVDHVEKPKENEADEDVPPRQPIFHGTTTLDPPAKAAASRGAVGADMLSLISSKPQPAQAPTAPAAFEVVSIKPAAPAGIGGRGGPGPPCGGLPRIVNNRFVPSSITAYALIALAYGKGECLAVAKSGLLAGGPDWMRTDRFEIQALIPEGSSTETVRQLLNGGAPKLQLMIQSLLTDRFKLVLHHESKEIPLYALTVARGGFKLQALKEESCTPHPLPPPEPPRCGSVLLKFGPFQAVSSGVNFEGLSSLLSLVLDRPVVEKTGITGMYDIVLKFAADENTPLPDGLTPPAASEPADPSVFTAIQEQLGLKLEPTKGPFDALVVDHIEKPLPN